jgi:anti-sigma28 factor (negative regulator of flagellin synthesis)
MRVDEQNLSAQVSSTANRAAESQRIEAGTAGSSHIGAAGGEDHVDLSSLAGRISMSLQGLSNQTSQRVSQLQKDFQAGRYQPDAQQLSRAMVQDWQGSAGS